MGNPENLNRASSELQFVQVANKMGVSFPLNILLRKKCSCGTLLVYIPLSEIKVDAATCAPATVATALRVAFVLPTSKSRCGCGGRDRPCARARQRRPSRRPQRQDVALATLSLSELLSLLQPQPSPLQSLSRTVAAVQVHCQYVASILAAVTTGQSVGAVAVVCARVFTAVAAVALSFNPPHGCYCMGVPLCALSHSWPGCSSCCSCTCLRALHTLVSLRL